MLRNGTPRTHARGRTRAGMTLVEVIVSLSILAGTLLGMGAFTIKFAHTVRLDSMKSVAVELAADRIETVKGANKYSTLKATYETTESSISGYPGFSRQTYVTHVGGGDADLVDYMIVTVEVRSPPMLVKPIQKTTIIGTF
jgi:prepilin-type N-terminal cleavage/methylation domain-containing protein